MNRFIFLANIDNDPQKEIFLQATELASACGALTTTKLGAQASLPNLEELNRFSKAHGKSADLSL